MTPSQVTFEIRGTLLPEVFAICGSCDALGNWNPQNAVALLPENETASMLWKATILLSRGVSVQHCYFKGYFLEPKTIVKLLLTMDNLESTGEADTRGPGGR
uniref:CBM20 domain-containing protein n=1 Tax=Pan paniscus TaxID=9597 RepID=A0A2R9A073_PANPA